jgi:hypothetical protein
MIFGEDGRILNSEGALSVDWNVETARVLMDERAPSMDLS